MRGESVRVSVVVTAYNLEDFVGQAVDSALGQTRPPFEVIVVDDCSTDATVRVLAKYGDRIRLISLPENVGGLRAALAGLKEARGEIVACLDGDDVWAPTKLEKCVSVFEHDADMILVSHQHARVDRFGRPLNIYDATHRNIDHVLRTHHTVDERSDAFKRSILEKLGYWLGSAFTFRRDALDLADFERWVGTITSPRDVYLDLTIAPYLVLTNPGKRVGLVDERLFDYRIHGNNSCNDYRDVERALRAVRRGYHTTLAANDLNRRFASLAMARAGMAAHEEALRYYRYLEALYSGHRVEASGMFAMLVRDGYFSLRSLLKESARLAIVWVGGTELFLRLKRAEARKERGRAYPTGPPPARSGR
jgi:glycosyltransferase involved in cell wall biosynthesis